MNFIGTMLGFAFVCFVGSLLITESFSIRNESIIKTTIVVGVLCAFWIAYHIYELCLSI